MLKFMQKNNDSKTVLYRFSPKNIFVIASDNCFSPPLLHQHNLLLYWRNSKNKIYQVDIS